ncbi:MAG: CBS domain-containing protein [Gammaproteobacteria bacterium]|nr:CBS domain-containing protein [Gammaproteobacteria bacterium]
MSDHKIVRVRDIMKQGFDSVDGMSTVREALEKMRYVETKCLLVNKRHADDEFGILLISEIARQVIGRDRSPDRVNVYEIMTKPVVSVDPGMDIRYCARLFEQLNLSRAPVLENGEIIGIVSFTDMVLKGLAAE